MFGTPDFFRSILCLSCEIPKIPLRTMITHFFLFRFLSLFFPLFFLYFYFFYRPFAFFFFSSISGSSFPSLSVSPLFCCSTPRRRPSRLLCPTRALLAGHTLLLRCCPASTASQAATVAPSASAPKVSTRRTRCCELARGKRHAPAVRAPRQLRR